jgi:glycosyltransferase involved in cell wall biosynthesis
MPTTQPLVSVITPVYNCEQYLSQCIESVLEQSYGNWEYVIVNNRSNDRSAAIAEEYAARDSRIKVMNCSEFLPVVANHNRAIREIAADAKYCKFVFADDWLYPHCIERMVELAEAHPSVGLVGAYGTDGRNVLWTGIRGRQFEIQPPSARDVMPGREVCKNKLLGLPYVFGNSGSLLIRGDLIRQRPDFFNENILHADLESCFDLLQRYDFGFIHQILTYTRRRDESEGSFARDYNSIVLGDYIVFLKYGPVFLSEEEFLHRLREVSWEYYRALGRNVLRMRGKDFWDYHGKTLNAFGVKIDYTQLTLATLTAFAHAILEPKASLGRLLRWWPMTLKRMMKT